MKNTPKPHPYLIKFTYEYYCQGYEEATESVLVYAYSFEQACSYISMKYNDTKNFENMTMGSAPKDL